jgi:hypothetical protein
VLIASTATPFTVEPMTNAAEVRSAWSRLDPATTLLGWLGPVNVLIGVFPPSSR